MTRRSKRSWWRLHFNGGFSLLELMVVIAIIGILLAIAIPQFMIHRASAFDEAAQADVKNAYTSAQAAFTRNPAATITETLLAENGFRRTEGVVLTIGPAKMYDLQMTTKHPLGALTFTVTSVGKITSR